VDSSAFFLKTISDIFTAGGAITAFSLLIYVVTFQIKDLVTRTYTILLACVVVILGTDAFFTTTINPGELSFLLRLQYIGLIIVPTAYFYFSNALLSLTGKPSQGKRTVFGIITIGVSLVFIYLNFTGKLYSDIAIDNSPVPNIQRTMFFDVFTGYFIIVLVAVWYNFVRAVQRTASKKSKRRMIYLVIAAFGPALGSFPYLLYGSSIIQIYPSLFWLISIIAYLLISISIIAMTYTVSFFGLPWPDRLIKSRLLKWIMRGPATAILTLGVTTIISRLGAQYNLDLSAFEILGMVATIVIFEFSVTIFAPYWERILFFGDEKNELEKIRQLENKLLTKNDLQHLLELILASFCDMLQTKNAAIYEILDGSIGKKIADIGQIGTPLEFNATEIDFNKSDDSQILLYRTLKQDLIFPIYQSIGEVTNLLGILHCPGSRHIDLNDEKQENLKQLVSRASMVLYDRKQQENIINSLEIFTPQVSELQTLLASSRFNQSKIYRDEDITASEKFNKYVKDALDHFFGGPRLSRSPLLQLISVKNRINFHSETAVTALRAILHQAIDRLRPNGERRHTNEWLLFNIIDYKFLEGWKVRDLCRKLSLSEADFYRKQKIAVSAVADQIMIIERENN